MEIFKSDLFILIIVIFLFCFGRKTHQIMKARLENIEGSFGVGYRDLRPNRSAAGAEAKAEAGPLRRLRGVCSELFSSYRVYGELWRLGTRRETLMSAAGEMLLVVAISVSMALFCNHTDGGSDLYMTTFMTLMYVLAALILFARCVNGARGVYLPCCFMILCGIALAVLLYLSPMAAVAANHIGPPDESVLFQVLAVVLGLLAFPLIRMVCHSSHRGVWLIVLNLLVIGLYGALVVLGKEINGARNWIIIGGFSFQVSEVTKVLSAAIFGLTLTHERLSEKARFWWTTATMALNGVCLLVFNEFGTLLLLCAVYVGMCLVYQKKLKRLFFVIITASIAAACILAAAKYCYDITPKMQAQTVAVSSASEETPAFSKKHTYTPEKDAKKEKKAEKASISKPLYIKFGGYYKKFMDRFLIFLAPEEVDMDKEGYQWKMSREALVISDWFGSPYDIAVPVARSDFIFSYLIVRLGMVFGFATLVLLAVMLCVGTIRCLRNPSPGEASISLAFLIAMVVQSIIAAASSTGHFVIVGIPFAFLAYGGSATMMNYVMLVFLIYATRLEPLESDGSSRRLIISRREEE